MRGSATVFRRAFSVTSVLWALVLPLAPFAAAHPSPADGWYAFALVAYTLGSVICHQRPERSFHLWAAQMPVCARCTGIYAGAALAAIVASARQVRLHPFGSVRLHPFGSVRLQPDCPGARNAVVVAALPTATTLIYEWATGRVPDNWVRALTGLPLGAAVAFIVVTAWSRSATTVESGLPDEIR